VEICEISYLNFEMLELLKRGQKVVYFVPRLTDGYIDANIDEMKFGRLCPSVCYVKHIL
jgi:hypothetical protein